MKLLLMLLLEQLLLSRAQMLQVRVRTRGHCAHHGGIHLATRPRHRHVAAELLRHPAARCTLLCGVWGHARPHGMTSDGLVAHGGGMSCKVWAHTRGHHFRNPAPAIHDVDVDKRVLALSCVHAAIPVCAC